MPSEQEELRLTVSLVDNASAGIVALKNNIQSLTSGQTRQSFETFKRQQAELGDGIKAVTTAAFGGEKALLGFIGKFGALGLAASAAIADIKRTADAINSLRISAQAFGIQPVELKNLTDQLQAVGVSIDDAKNEVTGFADALAGIGRRGSPEWNELMNKAGRYRDIMANLIDHMEKLPTYAAKMNAARQAAEGIRAARYQQDITGDNPLLKSPGAAAADAAKVEREFLALLKEHLEIQLKLGPLGGAGFKEMTAEQARANQNAITGAANVEAAWNKVNAAVRRVGESMVGVFGPDYLRAAGSMNTRAEQVTRAAEYLRDRLLGGAAGDVGNKGVDAEGKPKPFARGGIVSRPTFSMLGEAGPEAVVPLSGGDLFGGEATRDNTRETTDNTKQLRMLNEQLFLMLHPDAAGGMRGGGLGGIGLGGVNIGGGGAPYGSDVGLGTGLGAQAGGGGAGKWWTPERSSQAVDTLVKGGVPKLAAQALVARFAGVEAGGGPGDVNPSSGARGIAQWLGSRARGLPGDFGGQLQHVLEELHGPEGAAFQRMLAAKTPEEAAIAAASYERAEGYNKRTGADAFVGKTLATMGQMFGSGGTVATGGAGRANFMHGQFGGPGQNLVQITTAGGHTLTVNAASAPHIKSFIESLESAGAPISSLYGYSNRNIAGTGMKSQHAYGNAIDIDQLGRNVVTPQFRAWAEAHPEQLRAAMAQSGMISGGDWRNPDFGHFEWGGGGNIETARQTIDAHSVRTQKIEATGKLTADINAPPGTDVTLEGGGVFRKIEVNRQVQMAKAARGPRAGDYNTP